MSLNESYQMDQEYISFKDGDLNCFFFLDIGPFMKRRGRA